MSIALLSVSNKSGLVEFARELAEMGWEFVASGGTAKKLREAGLAVTGVSELTNAPEMLGGRVKTLHPTVHGGILARATDEDMAELATYNIKAIDMVVCNLYPFQQTIAKPDVTLTEAIEKIDIGGVTLLRAAAKNFARVTVLCDPASYPVIVEELRKNGSISADTKAELARQAFIHTGQYDAAISGYLAAQTGDDFPDSLPVYLTKTQTMRYGENPHQSAALYAANADIGPLGGTLLQGKALSYNNMLDVDAAWQAAQAFDPPTVVIVKHLCPCGLATADDLVTAYHPALASDPVSAFGGVIAVNREFDEEIAQALGKQFVEVIAAPSFSQAARDVLSSRKNCRLLEITERVVTPIELRTVEGGVVVQQRDTGDPAGTEWSVVTERTPTDEEMTGLKFAWTTCQHVKSNAIVFAVGTTTVGIGGGLPSRIDATKLAAAKAGAKSNGAVMASDAFFPFPDGIEAAAEFGIKAVIQPGGSIRDEQVIEAANRLGLAMVFTGVRHFRH